MKRQLLVPGLVAAICMGGSLAADIALANTQSDARIALHIRDIPKKSGCGISDPNVTNTPCSNFVTHQNSNEGIWHVFLVVAQGQAPGVAGMSCGLDTDFAPSNALNYSWTLCADLEFPNDGGNGPWPADEGGNRVTWNSVTNCQTQVEGGDGIHAVAGFFYIYNYGDPLSYMQITPNNNVPDPELQVADCNAVASDLHPLQAGRATWGLEEGYNPCGAVPVETTTWGSLKRQYE
jgi:hypothetical protein